jgi:phosphatidylglycerol lysyltransferase
MHVTIKPGDKAVAAWVEPILPVSAAPDVTTRLPRSRPLASVTILAWAVRFSAMLNLLAFSEHHASRLIYWAAAWVPFEVSIGRRLLMLLTAVMLFLLSSGLERGKRIAWALTIGALIFAPLIHLGRTVIWPQVLLNLPLILLLCANHRFFVARSDQRSLRSALIICPLLLIALMIFGTLRLHDLRFETSGSDSWGACLQAAFELVFVQNAHAQHAQTHQSLLLFSELRIGGTSIALLALFLALRPALRPQGSNAQEEARMDQLVRNFGNDPLHSYALLGDKTFFFNTAKSVGIPYVMSGRFAIALADPIGYPEARAGAIQEFAEFCRYQDWVPIFYQITSELLSVYERLGFGSFQIGEDARIEAAQFDLKGSSFQNLRTLCNKAQKEGLRFYWYDHFAGNDGKLEGELAEISRLWLAHKNGREMTFDMGSFSREEIRRCGAAVAFDANGRALAFATWRSFADGTGRGLDLMRSRPENRNVLDFILVESIKHFRSQGITDIDLGNAPLARAEKNEKPDAVVDHAVRFIYENLNNIYAYKPLFEFKRKYRPKWRKRSLAYPRGESLPLIGLALVRVHTRQAWWRIITG